MYTTSSNFSNHVRKKHPEHAYTLSLGSKLSQKSRGNQRLNNDSFSPEDDGLFSHNSTRREGSLDYESLFEEMNGHIEMENSTTIGDDSQFRADNSDEEEVLSFEIGSELEDDAEQSGASDAREQFPDVFRAGKSLYPTPANPNRSSQINHLYPFQTPFDYKLARFFNGSRIPMSKIDEFFKDGLVSVLKSTKSVSFKSAYTLNNKLDAMTDDPPWKHGTANYSLQPNTPYYYRNILDCIRYLIRQKSYASYMVYAPVYEYDEAGHRTYSEMNTATWWADKQKTLPVGSTLIPVLFASDQTHLTNFSGDKKLWPWYMSIGNIESTVRNKPSYHAWIPLALLPIPPKRMRNIPGNSIDKQEVETLQILHEVISFVLSPITDENSQSGYKMECADENVRLCFPAVSAWMADHMENANLHAININRCPSCTAKPDELGHIPDEKFPSRNYLTYAQALQSSDTNSLTQDGVKRINSALWHLDIEPRDLVRADLLHNLYLGTLKHLMGWIQDFLAENRRLHVFDTIWSQLPPYPGFTPPTKTYRAVTQWQGKEMRNLGRVILGSFTAALRRKTNLDRPTKVQAQDFERAITCVRHLTDFHLYAQYRQHTDLTIQSMNKSLLEFHKTKDVFLQYRAGKGIRKDAREKIKHLAAEQSELYAANRPNMTSSERKKQIHQDQEERAEVWAELLKDNADYNIPKIHLISHYAEQISKFGSLPQYSTEICEASHKAFKDGYRRSNHIDATPQIIIRYTRDHNFHMHTQNLRAWANELTDMPQEICDLVGVQTDSTQEKTSKKNIPAPTKKIYVQLRGRVEMSSISNVKQLATSHHINDLHSLLVERFGAFPDANRLISDATVECFQSLVIPVSGFQDDEINTHVARCTGPYLFRKKTQRADWVWVRRREPSNELRGSLNGRLPGKLNALFKLRTTSQGIHLLAHVSLLEPVGSARPTGPEGMVRVAFPTRSVGILVNIRHIIGVAHLIPLEPGERWLVNNRIDFDTWHEIYDNFF